MASSKVMASTSPANPDLPRQSASSSIHHHSLTLSDHHHHHHHTDSSSTTKSNNFGSMNMDELLKNIYPDSDAFPADAVDGGGGGDGGGGLTSQGSFNSLVKGLGNDKMEEVWKEMMVSGGGTGENREPEMTLEDFLTKAGAVTEEDVRLPVPGYAVDSIIGGAPTPPQFQAPGIGMQSAGSGPTGGFGIDPVGFGNGIVPGGAPPASGGSGRGKRRAVEEPPVDRATQQKQRRMIKNRESAARSRERKQAYTVELESLVTQLEEENARLVREEEEKIRERYKQLMENLIPIGEKPRPPRVLLHRRSKSM